MPGLSTVLNHSNITVVVCEFIFYYSGASQAIFAISFITFPDFTEHIFVFGFCIPESLFVGVLDIVWACRDDFRRQISFIFILEIFVYNGGDDFLHFLFVLFSQGLYVLLEALNGVLLPCGTVNIRCGSGHIHNLVIGRKSGLTVYFRRNFQITLAVNDLLNFRWTVPGLLSQLLNQFFPAFFIHQHFHIYIYVRKASLVHFGLDDLHVGFGVLFEQFVFFLVFLNIPEHLTSKSVVNFLRCQFVMKPCNVDQGAHSFNIGKHVTADDHTAHRGNCFCHCVNGVPNDFGYGYGFFRSLGMGGNDSVLDNISRCTLVGFFQDFFFRPGRPGLHCRSKIPFQATFNSFCITFVPCNNILNGLPICPAQGRHDCIIVPEFNPGFNPSFDSSRDFSFSGSQSSSLIFILIGQIFDILFPYLSAIHSGHRAELESIRTNLL